MKSRIISGFAVLLLFFLGLLLSGCNDVRKFLDRMNLTEDETKLARPILIEHVKKTDKVFEDMEKQRPGGGQGRPPQGGPPPQGQGGFNGERPDMSKMNDPMDKRRAEIENKFALIDAQTAAQLANFLSADKIEEFKLAAADYREEKMKSARKGPPSGGNSPGGNFGGPPD